MGISQKDISQYLHDRTIADISKDFLDDLVANTSDGLHVLDYGKEINPQATQQILQEIHQQEVILLSKQNQLNQLQEEIQFLEQDIAEKKSRLHGHPTSSPSKSKKKNKT
eukprot:TRINITY_DN7887_c0_g1_i1.p2 TRINITY_DN7887_c0_g1~~TRINITY_DN7887_c0_g1_i1.p2  ORF type:complete len:110 (+),score=33.16 TRINITY_DN7887_c0_g1_i1:557-886(+)